MWFVGMGSKYSRIQKHFIETLSVSTLTSDILVGFSVWYYREKGILMSSKEIKEIVKNAGNDLRWDICCYQT